MSPERRIEILERQVRELTARLAASADTFLFATAANSHQLPRGLWVHGAPLAGLPLTSGGEGVLIDLSC